VTRTRHRDAGLRQTRTVELTAESLWVSDAAEAAGMAIKKGHPVVRVSIYDAVECVNRAIELPKA
jgi:hypothetical protein